MKRLDRSYRERRSQQQVGVRLGRRTTERHPDRDQEEKTDQQPLAVPIFPSPTEAEKGQSSARSNLNIHVV